MEIYEAHDIEIFHTLNSIRLANQMMKRHIDAQSENLLIDQYRLLKQQLCEQLAGLLSQTLEAKVQIVV